MPTPQTSSTKGSLRGVATAVALSFFLFACGGGSDLAAEAEEKSAATCACTTFDCTTEYIMWFNRVSITQDDDLDALSPADLERYRAASSEAANCQDDLR